MTDKEHRDVYIAAAVGGLGLVLVLLYLFGGSAPVSAATNASGAALPTATETSPPGIDNYNYNIAPYNPAPLLPYGKSSIAANGGGGCCDDCGPDTGSQYNNVNVAQFQTLLGTGAG